MDIKVSRPFIIFEAPPVRNASVAEPKSCFFPQELSHLDLHSTTQLWMSDKKRKSASVPALEENFGKIKGEIGSTSFLV